MKLFSLSLIFLVSIQSWAYTIECLSENNIDVSLIGFENLMISSTEKGNWIKINDKVTKLGESLPVRLSPLVRPSTQAESFTVLTSLQLGSLTFSPGSVLTYTHNKMELNKYRDTVVTFYDFGKRQKIDIDCQLKK